MQTWKVLCVTLLSVAVSRGVRVVNAPRGGEPAAFDRAHSTALFVGVREFPNDGTLGEVRYAADDAINLAWVFAFDPRVSLVPPARVTLALAGEPQKKKSKEQLQQLRDAGAAIAPAGRDDIERLIQQQAARVGSGGIFIAGFATHGFSSEGASYLLASTSVYEQRETSIATAKIREVAETAPRSLLFFDACRERQGTRGAPLPPPFLEGLSQTAGQVVFTVSGEYAYENPAARNGAFTAAVVDGLQCKAARDGRGFVTVETLADYVETRLLTWLRKYREPHVRTAIRLTTDGDSDSMPLARCATPPRLPSPARVAWDGNAITAFDGKGVELWRRTAGRDVARAEVADLDGDGANEVVAAVDGKLTVLHRDGEPWWTADTNAPGNYDGTGTLILSKFVIGDLFRKKRHQIVALSVDESGAPSSRVSLFDVDGTLIGAYFHPGRLQDVAIAAPTSRHAPKIVVTGVNAALHETLSVCGRCNSVFLLDPKKVEGEAPPYRGKLGSGTQVWYGYVQAPSIERLEIVDRDNDGKRDISLALPNGRLSLDFQGRIIEARNAQFGLVK